jgi:hypothetical protein
MILTSGRDVGMMEAACYDEILLPVIGLLFSDNFTVLPFLFGEFSMVSSFDFSPTYKKW